MKLALDLLHADSEAEVVAILRQADIWEDSNLWRLYGDKEGNFAQAGNQQSLPEAALVEKIVNCCDSRLMCACQLAGIDPESDDAPNSVRDAVARFFEKSHSDTEEAGTLANWPKAERIEESRNITIAATGDRPTQGRRARRMCITITDQAEGQSPSRLPKTILSLNEKNKQRIRFVQGKFNMGGSGALRFCGNLGLQLVISRRHPDLANSERSRDGTVDLWAVTVVRREEPSNKSGDPIHSEFTYLAPVGAELRPRGGEVFGFEADTLPLMPEQDDAYKREVSWGTAIKLFEYDTTVGQSNVLLKDGLLYAVERLLPEIALPVRMHECRGYGGQRERSSFETSIAGLVVRLEDGKGDNLEPGFPKSVELQVGRMHMKARLYAFREDRAQTYLHDEGVIFTTNGQAHGYLPKSIFTRPKAVGLPRLKDSLLVLVDCSSLATIQREDLFMSSRDRLSKKPIRYEIEEEIEQLLRTNPDLRRLQQERRQRDVESRLIEEKPLEKVLGRIFTASPTLQALFLKGQRLARPFAEGGGHGSGNGTGSQIGHREFRGKRHPTYFRIPGLSLGQVFTRNCENARRCRIEFETDAENGYFDRTSDRGHFELEIIDAPRLMEPPSFSLTLEDGEAFLNMALPSDAGVGDTLVLQATVRDPIVLDPFVTVVRLNIKAKQVHPSGPRRPRPQKHQGGDGQDQSRQGIELPPVIPVREHDEHWTKYRFDSQTACHVISDPVVVDGKTRVSHTFYINIDNASLKTEMKYTKQDVRLLEAKFKYGNVLLGLAILHDSEAAESRHSSANQRNLSENSDKESTEDTIRRVTAAVAPVLLPIIDQLSGLDDEHLEEFSAAGEDV